MRKLCEIHIGVCTMPNTLVLVSVRVLDRGRIIVAGERGACMLQRVYHPSFLLTSVINPVLPFMVSVLESI